MRHTFAVDGDVTLQESGERAPHLGVANATEKVADCDAGSCRMQRVGTEDTRAGTDDETFGGEKVLTFERCRPGRSSLVDNRTACRARRAWQH
jgi:hypothetical protein